jgi:hypothetical protein
VEQVRGYRLLVFRQRVASRLARRAIPRAQAETAQQLGQWRPRVVGNLRGGPRPRLRFEVTLAQQPRGVGEQRAEALEVYAAAGARGAQHDAVRAGDLR